MTLAVDTLEQYGGVSYISTLFEAQELAAGASAVSDVINIVQETYSIHVSADFGASGALTVTALVENIDPESDGLTPAGYDNICTDITSEGVYMFSLPPGLYRRLKITNTGSNSVTTTIVLAAQGRDRGEKGDPGADAPSATFRSYDGYIQWYDFDAEAWRNLTSGNWGSEDLATVAGSIANVNSVAEIQAELLAVYGSITDIESCVAALGEIAQAPSSAELAEKWASEDEDVVVEDGKYSAYHWAQKAEDFSGGSITDSDFSSNGVMYRAGEGVYTSITIGIGDGNLVEVDDTDAESGDFARFTSSGLQGLSAGEVRAALNIEDGADVTDADNVAEAGATMNSDSDISSNSWVVDEDDMASDTNTKVPTQQSVKAYVDSKGTSGWELIGIATPTNVSSLEFTNLSSYRFLRLTFSLVPATDDVDLCLRTSTNNGSSYDAGSSDYINYDNYASEATIAYNVGSSSGEYVAGTIHFNGFNQARPGFIIPVTSWIKSTGGMSGNMDGYLSSYYWARASSVVRNAFKIYFSSGNIESGYIILEGVQ